MITRRVRPLLVHVPLELAEFAPVVGEDWRMTGSGSAFLARCSMRAETGQGVAVLGPWAGAS